MLYWVDLGIIGIIALSILTGLFRGFIKELIALSVWILAIWLAFNYSQNIDPWLQKYIGDQTVRTITAFILVMIATLIAGGLINSLLGVILKHSGLSGTDRILGMGFGFVRGIFLVALIMVVIKMTSLPHEQYSNDSKLYAKFDPIVNWLYASMPNVIKQVNFFDKIPEEGAKKLLSQANLVDVANDFELSDG